MTRIKKLRGFTLIELIVVIIIIGVLAAIAAVAYNQFVADSHTAALQSDAVQLRTAVDAASAKADVAAKDELSTLEGNASTTAVLDALGYQGGASDHVVYDATANTLTVVSSGKSQYITLELGATLSSPTKMDAEVTGAWTVTGTDTDTDLTYEQAGGSGNAAGVTDFTASS